MLVKMEIATSIQIKTRNFIKKFYKKTIFQLNEQIQNFYPNFSRNLLNILSLVNLSYTSTVS